MSGLGAGRISFNGRRRKLAPFGYTLAGESSCERTLLTRGRRNGVALGSRFTTGHQRNLSLSNSANSSRADCRIERLPPILCLIQVSNTAACRSTALSKLVGRNGARKITRNLFLPRTSLQPNRYDQVWNERRIKEWFGQR